MALNVKKGVLTAPTTTGTQTINLAAGFDLKAVLLFTSHDTAEAVTDSHAFLSLGMASLDGGAVQKGYQSTVDDDALAASEVGGHFGTDAVLRGYLSGGLSPTIDFVADMSAMTSTSFTLNWTNAPAAAIKVHYLAIGGSDVAAARVFSFVPTSSVASEDITVNTGFGQPDALVFLARQGAATLNTNLNAGQINLSAGIPGGAGRSASYGIAGSAATMGVGVAQVDHALAPSLGASTGGSTAFAFRADISAKANGPTDGFQLDYVQQKSGTAAVVIGLALRGTFVATIDNAAIPTAAAPQTQTHNATSGNPRGGIIWGTSEPASASNIISGGDLGGFFLGATDGTDEGAVGVCQDDDAADSYTGRFHSESKAYRVIKTDAGAPATQSEADAALTSSALELTWTDTDSVARDYSFLILSEPSAVTAVGEDLDLAWSVQATAGEDLALPWTIGGPVDVASTGNVVLPSGAGTEPEIDGVTLVGGDPGIGNDYRVLLKDQTDPSENGIYVFNVQVGPVYWQAVRAGDADTWDELVGLTVAVLQGDTNSGTSWECTVAPGGTLETTAVTWQPVTDPVGEDLELAYGVTGAIGEDLDLSWEILGGVGEDLDLVWGLLAAVGEDLDLVWQTAIDPAGEDLDLAWRIFAPGEPLRRSHSDALEFELTTLWTPGAGMTTLSMFRQYTDAEITIPHCDARRARVALSIYDQALKPLRDHLGDGNSDPSFWMALKARYRGRLVFWGPIVAPEWDAAAGTVTLNAIDPAVRPQHHYLRTGDTALAFRVDRDGNWVDSDGLQGDVTIDYRGLRLLLDAARNTEDQIDRGVPDIGIAQGVNEGAEHDRTLRVERGQEVWQAMLELTAFEDGPEFELEPREDISNAYCVLNTFGIEGQGTDRTRTLTLQHGYGADNLENFQWKPGGRIITHQHLVSRDKRLRVTQADADASELYGVYVGWEEIDANFGGIDPEDALYARARAIVQAYSRPVNHTELTLSPAAGRYLDDFAVGDLIAASCRRGYMRAAVDGRITQVQLKQRDSTGVIQPVVTIVPNVGAIGSDPEEP